MLALNLPLLNREKTPINVLLNVLEVVSVCIIHVIFLILLSV